MRRVLCIAECCCDMVFAGLPHIPALGEEVYGETFVLKPGGGANTAINLGRLEVPTAMLTRIGDDVQGRLVHQGLVDAGVEPVGEILAPDVRTAVSAVLSTAEDRCFASYGGSGGAPFRRADLEREIARADIIHTYLGYCLHFPIAELCRQGGKILSLDTSWCDTERPDEASRALRSCDYLKVNAAEAARLTGCDTPEAALNALAAQVRRAAVITLGAAGSIGMTRGGELLRCLAAPCEVFRDACGAGDSYAAGLLRGIAADLPLRESMALGAQLSALCVGWYGGNDETLNPTKLRADFHS